MTDDGQQLSLVVEHHEDRMSIRLRGELDIVTAPALVDALSEADREVVVDLAELDFIDASGLGAIARAGDRAQEHGDRLVVVNASPLAQRMFELTGLEHLLSGSDAP